MIDSVPGTGVDVLIPDGQEGRVDVSSLSFTIDGETVEGVGVTVGAAVTGLEINQGGGDQVLVTGAKVSDSTITFRDAPPTTLEGASARAGDESLLALQNTVNEDVTIKAKNKIEVDLRIDGKFRRSSFTAANGKQADEVRIDSGAKLINSEFKLKKGGDTFTLTGGATLKKTNTVDLGKKGVDTVVIGDDIKAKKKASLVIENMSKKDTLSYGGEDYSLKQIRNGNADLPSFIELGE